MLLFFAEIYYRVVNETYTNVADNVSNNTTSGSGSGSGFGIAPDEGSGSVSNASNDTVSNDRNSSRTPAMMDQGLQYTNISISLPFNVFSHINSTDVGLLYSYYRDSNLFPLRVETETGHPAIASPVIGASLVQTEPIVNLTQPIVMVLPYRVVRINNIVCVFHLQ